MMRLSRLTRPVTLFGDTVIRQREAVFQKNQTLIRMTIITIMIIMTMGIMVTDIIVVRQKN